MKIAALTTALAFSLVCFSTPSVGEPAHGIAMHGSLKHGADYAHFSYADPSAPKGGKVNRAVLGAFDSLNPLIVKGVSAAGVRGYVYESLLARAFDEPFSLYGLIAEKVETPDDRSWVEFTLNEKAAFSDGSPVDVKDVIFSHSVLRDKGRPNHRFYYSKVTKVEQTGPRKVRFTFNDEGDREMPLIMGLMPILPSHILSHDTFERTTLEPVVGSGPYRIVKVEPGRSITYARNKNYWGKDIPANRGHYNFDEIRFDYYRDANSIFEAFKKGLYDVREEGDPGRWARGYEFPAVKDKLVVREKFDLAIPSGMSALVFNLRRPLFQDPLVRQALVLMFDFEWINKNLYHGLYARTQSFFDRSELSSHGKPADERERKLLTPYQDAVLAEILEGRFSQPVTNGTGRNRESRRQALRLLKEAGYHLKNGVLIKKSSGEPVVFEIVYVTKSQERLFLNFARSLKQVGITVRLRQVDSAQYQRRKKTFEFDMLQSTWFASLSPGNEQNFRWSSKAADTEGTFNYPGIKNAAVDAMIKALLAARTREDFVSAVRALDRVLLSGHYVIPLFHLPKQWVARWGHIRHPGKHSLYGLRFDCWWAAQEKAVNSQP